MDPAQACLLLRRKLLEQGDASLPGAQVTKQARRSQKGEGKASMSPSQTETAPERLANSGKKRTCRSEMPLAGGSVRVDGFARQSFF